jgi:hypothetical protein
MAASLTLARLRSHCKVGRHLTLPTTRPTMGMAGRARPCGESGAAYEPKNVIDLNWKIQLLSALDREKYAAQISALIDKLYEYETPEGAWPYPFDKKAKPADFVSYHAVLALAEAGRRPESDEHLARAVKAMLAAQRPEGSWEGDPVYQGFNTPFPRHAVCRDGACLRCIREQQSQKLGRGLPRACHHSCHQRSTAASGTTGSVLGSGFRTGSSPDSQECFRKATSRLRGKLPPARLGTWLTPARCRL